jgi:hypothetical protein
MTFKLDPKIKARWLRALKNGLYKKGRGQLVTMGRGGDRFCCLGVLADLQGAEFVEGAKLCTPTRPTSQLRGYYLTDKKLSCGIPKHIQHKLAAINDRSATFAPVIRHIQTWL